MQPYIQINRPENHTRIIRQSLASRTQADGVAYIERRRQVGPVVWGPDWGQVERVVVVHDAAAACVHRRVLVHYLVQLLPPCIQ